jgi:hypothetical protein
VHAAPAWVLQHGVLTMQRDVLASVIVGMLAAVILMRAPSHASRSAHARPAFSGELPPAPTVRRWQAPAPSVAPEVLAPSATAELTGMDRMIANLAKVRAERERYPEAVIVRRADGTRRYYRPEDWAPDSEDIIARKYLDGDIRYYAGPDAGPRSDPAAWKHLRDLAGPDGRVDLGNGVRMQFIDPDPAAVEAWRRDPRNVYANPTDGGP